MNSCMARPLPACSPPLITLKLGTGSTWAQQQQQPHEES
jgi:hypothetical protein